MARLLNLVLEFDWFDKIKSGEKTTEYRAASDWWNSTFKGLQVGMFSLVRFQRGY